MPISTNYKPDPQLDQLGEGFYDIVEPAKFPLAKLRYRNQQWAERMGLGELTNEEWIKHFAHFEPLPQNFQHPLALRYHGHQFRHYNPDLGDGRGFLFAQLRDPVDGRLLDLGTKGSGQTPWSRAGDGRLTLKGAVREVLATEMLEMHGVDTSKTLSVIETGENLERNDEPSPTRSGVLVRLSHSHIRFGSFQRHAAARDLKRLEALLDYSIRYFYPQLTPYGLADRAAAFLEEVAKKSAATCAGWMVAGFVHGVLNTDNMNITGESFDYGPYRFLPTYDPRFTAAYFDQSGLYSYGRQPESVIWNLEQLASCLLFLMPEDSGKDSLIEALNKYAPAFNEAMVEKFFERIGLLPTGDDDRDSDLMMAAFEFLYETQLGYDQFFFDWYGGLQSQTRAMTGEAMDHYRGEIYEKFHRLLEGFQTNPQAAERLKDRYFTRPKPCSLLIDEIEWIWEAIDKRDDWVRFEKKVEDIRRIRQLFGRERTLT